MKAIQSILTLHSNAKQAPYQNLIQTVKNKKSTQLIVPNIISVYNLIMRKSINQIKILLHKSSYKSSRIEGYPKKINNDLVNKVAKLIKDTKSTA